MSSPDEYTFHCPSPQVPLTASAWSRLVEAREMTEDWRRSDPERLEALRTLARECATWASLAELRISEIETWKARMRAES